MTTTITFLAESKDSIVITTDAEEDIRENDDGQRLLRVVIILQTS